MESPSNFLKAIKKQGDEESLFEEIKKPREAARKTH